MRLKNAYVMLICALVFGNADSAVSQFYFVKSEFLDAAPNSTELQFEGIAPTGEGFLPIPQPLICGIKFLYAGISDSEYSYGIYGVVPSDHLVSVTDIVVDFQIPVQAVGFELGISGVSFGSILTGGVLEVEILDRFGKLLDSTNVKVGPLDNPTTFVGFVETKESIGSVQVVVPFVPNVFHSMVLDNFNVSLKMPLILGDVNCDNTVNLLDIGPFVELISSARYQMEGDINQDGDVNLLDISLFVELIIGN